MKGKCLVFAAFGIGAILAGCSLGLAPRSPDYVYHPKPYRDYWVKQSMTEEGRKADWIACGGDVDGGSSMHVKRMLPGETNETSRLRQSSELKNCMSQRGYHYQTDRK